MIPRGELQPMNIDIPLAAGQDSSTDSRVVDLGSSPLVENGRFQTNGQLQKRYGVTSIPAFTTAGGAVAQGRQIFTAANTLFLHTGNELYVYNTLNTNWQLIGALNAGTVLNTVIAQSQNDILEISSAATANAACYAWREGSIIYASVYNTSNATYVLSAAVVAINGKKPNVFAFGNDFFIAWVDNPSNVLLLQKIAGANLSVLGATITVSGGLTMGGYYDIFARNVGGFAIVTSEVGGKLVFRNISSTPAVIGTITLTSGTWGTDSPVWGFTLAPGTQVGNSVLLGNANAYAALITSPVPVAFPATGPFAAGSVRRIYGQGTRDSNAAWAETTSTANGNSQVYLRSCSFDVAGVLTDQTNQYFTNTNTYFASRPFVADGFTYVWALADFKLQSQLVLLDQNCRAVGRALTNGAAAPNDGIFASLPYVQGLTDLNGATNYYFAARRRAQLKFDAGGNVSTTIGAALIDLRYQNPVVQAANVSGTVYIGGAAPRSYDGRLLSELGFWWYPDTPVLTTLPGSGNLTAGTYSYAICYAWYDNNGKLWRSPVILIPPGNAQPDGASGAQITANQNDAVQISNISYLQSAAKPGAVIEIYRTMANLTQYYKIGQIPNVSQLNTLTTTYVDEVADDDVAGEILYTDGSEPPYIAPPAFAYLAPTPNRIYGLVTETNEVWVSNLTSVTIPAQFVLGQTLSVPTLAQPPNCMGIMDGNLYIWTPDGILTTNADGTYLSSTNSFQFAPPRQLPVDAGCISPGSLLHTELGFWYQSPKGIMLLDRGQTNQFVGDPVKNYTDIITGALSVPAQQQLRFVAANQVLVYDYVYKRWSIYTGQTPISATRWNTNYILVNTSGRVKEERAGVFEDDNGYYTCRIVTPWIKPSGIGGYARCWRFVILGENRAPHTLQVRIAYQYDETWVDTLSIASTAVNPNGIYGVGLGGYGNTRAGVYGALPVANAYQFEAVMPRQKATAFKFEITDINSSGSGEAAALTVLSLHCGQHTGLARLSTGKRTG